MKKSTKKITEVNLKVKRQSRGTPMGWCYDQDGTLLRKCQVSLHTAIAIADRHGLRLEVI